MTQELLTVGETAKTLAIGRSTVYKLIAVGDIPHIKVGSSIRVPRKALEQWVDSKTVAPTRQEGK